MSQINISNLTFAMRAAMTIYFKTRLFRLTPIGKPDLLAETAAEKQRF